MLLIIDQQIIVEISSTDILEFKMSFNSAGRVTLDIWLAVKKEGVLSKICYCQVGICRWESTMHRQIRFYVIYSG